MQNLHNDFLHRMPSRWSDVSIVTEGCCGKRGPYGPCVRRMRSSNSAPDTQTVGVTYSSWNTPPDKVLLEAYFENFPILV